MKRWLAYRTINTLISSAKRRLGFPRVFAAKSFATTFTPPMTPRWATRSAQISGDFRTALPQRGDACQRIGYVVGSGRLEARTQNLPETEAEDLVGRQ